MRKVAAQKRAMLKELESRREERKELEQYAADLLVESWWSRWSREETST